MKKALYSIKMRSSQNDDHISGAERLMGKEELEICTTELLKRALNHSRGNPDFINIKVEDVSLRKIEFIKPLDITTIVAKDFVEGRKCAIRALESIGLKEDILMKAVRFLESSHSENGAVLLDIHDANKPELYQHPRLRVTYIDWCAEIREKLQNMLERETLHNSHIREALALASKVSNAPGVVAELCWSDDPDYVAGYVASKTYGYMRITTLKPLGSPSGGRVFFFDSSKAAVEDCIKYLKDQVTVINGVPAVKKTVSYRVFMEE